VSRRHLRGPHAICSDLESLKLQDLTMRDPRIEFFQQKLLEQIRQSGHQLPSAGPAPELIFEEVPEQPGWLRSQELSGLHTQGRPEQQDDTGRMRLFGHINGALMNRIYDVPSNVPLESIINFFEVGSHGANSYKIDKSAVMKLVTEKATILCSALPCALARANSGLLEFRITRKVTDEDLDKIGAIFSDCDPFEAGAEFYVTGQREGHHLFQNVQEERTFRFGWD
jgi:hypothetical protein